MPMTIELARLLLGLAIALFHAPLADFLREQDGAFGAALRERGVPFPGALPRRAARDLFFSLGIVIALISLTRIWLDFRA